MCKGPEAGRSLVRRRPAKRPAWLGQKMQAQVTIPGASKIHVRSRARFYSKSSGKLHFKQTSNIIVCAVMCEMSTLC